MRNSKKAKAAKPVKPATANVLSVTATPAVAKPAKPDASAVRAERQALTDAARNAVAVVYNGPSLAVHRAKPGKHAVYVARVQNPGHRTDTVSKRDESLLALIARNADKSGAFDPTAANINADLGIVSRLASLGLIVTDGTTITATDKALSLGRAINAKAA